MQRLEYEALIAEAQAFIKQAKTLRGSPARQQDEADPDLWTANGVE
jgi:hypothetical protein